MHNKDQYTQIDLYNDAVVKWNLETEFLLLLCFYIC